MPWISFSLSLIHIYSEWADSTLVDRLVENNCRLLGFQLYGGEPDNFNNFVLQIGNMIDLSLIHI